MIGHTFLNSLLKEPQKLSNLDFEDISEIITEATNIYKNESLLLEFNLKNGSEDIYVIGDIHGNFDTLLKLVELIKETNPKLVIFLGDIVDRGPKQLECLLFVLILKILNSQKYYL